MARNFIMPDMSGFDTLGNAGLAVREMQLRDQEAQRRNRLVDMQIAKYEQDLAQQKAYQEAIQKAIGQQVPIMGELPAYTSWEQQAKGLEGELQKALAAQQTYAGGFDPATGTMLSDPGYGIDQNALAAAVAEKNRQFEEHAMKMPQMTGQVGQRPMNQGEMYTSLQSAIPAIVASHPAQMDEFVKLANSMRPEFQPQVKDVNGLKLVRTGWDTWKQAEVNKPAELWTEPYEGEIGGKKVMLKRNIATNEVKPVVSDTSTTVRVAGAPKEKNLAGSDLVLLEERKQPAMIMTSMKNTFQPSFMPVGAKLTMSNTVGEMQNAIMKRVGNNPEATAWWQDFWEWANKELKKTSGQAVTESEMKRNLNSWINTGTAPNVVTNWLAKKEKQAWQSYNSFASGLGVKSQKTVDAFEGGYGEDTPKPAPQQKPQQKPAATSAPRTASDYLKKW